MVIGCPLIISTKIGIYLFRRIIIMEMADVIRKSKNIYNYFFVVVVLV